MYFARIEVRRNYWVSSQKYNSMAELDSDGITDVIVADDGFVASKDEVGYEDFEETYKAMWVK